MYNNMTNYLFIDGSYFCFFRYHALLTWWKNAHADDELGDRPMDNPIFVEKFKKLFTNKLKEIPKKLKIKDPVIIIGKDCHRQDIWRNAIFPQYKQQRESDDNIGGFFKMAYDELFQSAKVIAHPQLEGDDCIAIATKHYLEKEPDANVYIITSDMDYLQLCNERTHVYTLKYKKLDDSKTSFKNADKDLFCKIVMGDKSDNIPGIFNKCGIKTAEKLYEDQDAFIKKLNQANCNEMYERNKSIIDFNHIPIEYVNDVKQQL